MADRRCAVNSADFEKFLSDKGFVRTESGDEVVYVKDHDQVSHLIIKVYTSIRIGAKAARAVGEDAIRVCALFVKDEKTFGVGKFARVYRTGNQEGVFERTASRIEEATARCDEWLKEQAAKVRPSLNVNPPRYGVVERISGQHIGEVGQELALTLKVIKRLGPYANGNYLFKMVDRADNTYIFWSNKNVIQENEVYDMHGTVKGHNSFNGLKQTELTNCRGKRVVV